MFTFKPKSIRPRYVSLPPERQQSERQKKYQVDTFNTGGVGAGAMTKIRQAAQTLSRAQRR